MSEEDSSLSNKKTQSTIKNNTIPPLSMTNKTSSEEAGIYKLEEGNVKELSMAKTPSDQVEPDVIQEIQTNKMQNNS